MKTQVIAWGETPQAVARQLHLAAMRVEDGETTARGIQGTAGYDVAPFEEPIKPEVEPGHPETAQRAGWQRDDLPPHVWHHFAGDWSTCRKRMWIGGALHARDVREAGTCPECRRALEMPKFSTDLRAAG